MTAGVAAALIAIVGTGAIDAFHSEVGAFEEPVAHWNIYGGCGSGNGGGNCGTTPVANRFAFYVAFANPRPWTVTVNEMCSYQYAAMLNALQPLGYSGAFSITNTKALTGEDVNCGAPDGKSGAHGNAIFQLGSLVNNMTTYYYSSQEPGKDLRGLKCRTMSIYGFQRRGCVTHLDANASTYTVAQSAEANFILTGSIGGVPTKLGADLNMTNTWAWTAWRDVDNLVWAPTHSTRAVRNEKLDWFLASLVGHVSFGPAAIGLEPAYSDHAILSGRFITS